MRDVRLRSFLYAHLEVDRVSHYIYLHWLQVVEQITVIPISITNSILVFSQTLVKQFLVIHITLLHAEQSREVIRSIYRIAYPCDVADIVFLSFIQLEVNINVLVVIRRNTIL